MRALRVTHVIGWPSWVCRVARSCTKGVCKGHLGISERYEGNLPVKGYPSTGGMLSSPLHTDIIQKIVHVL